MIPLQAELPIVYLKPGELHISAEPNVVMTVLGSCVSIVMFNRRLGIGAICHGALPKCAGICSKEDNPGCCGNCSDPFRYVECSIYHMIGEFRKLGIGRNEIEVKLFGGADVLESKEGPPKATVGMQNISKALQIINSEGLKLVASDVGGERGYKVFFYTHTGDVWRKRIGKKCA